MPQRRRRRKRKLEPKFLVRRAVLVILLLAILGGGVWLAFFRKPSGGGDNPSGPDKAPQPTISRSSSRSSSWPEVLTDSPPAATASAQPETPSAPWNLLLVNASNPLPDGFEPELDTVTGDWQVDRRIVEPLTKMMNQARGEGIDLLICSAYRSVDKQTQLFESRKSNYLAQGMDEEEAVAATLTLTNRPGTSEHHTGLALDIVTPSYQNLDDGYADTPAAKWLLENAASFGFILRYPKDKSSITQVSFEPWHYRYVGEEHAKAIMEAGICLEEYIYGNREPDGTSQAPEDGSSSADEEEPDEEEPPDEG